MAEEKRVAEKRRTNNLALFPASHDHRGLTEHEGPTARQQTLVAPGAVHVPDWLSVDEQLVLIEHCRNWAKPPAPMRKTLLPGGKSMSVQTVSLGWHWLPYRYSRLAEDVDGAPVNAFPPWLGDLGRRAVEAAFGQEEGAGYQPDCALINYYDAPAKMGLHQDKDRTRTHGLLSIDQLLAAPELTRRHVIVHARDNHRNDRPRL